MPTNRKPLRPWIVACVVILLVLYVLSTGPMHLAVNKYHIKGLPFTIWRAYCGPVKWLIENWPAFYDFMDWYLRLWMRLGNYPIF